jgi:hypothetical protein
MNEFKVVLKDIEPEIRVNGQGKGRSVNLYSVYTHNAWTSISALVQQSTVMYLFLLHDSHQLIPC